MAPPPPELNPDAIAEILLRLPPDDPADLMRASAVCKAWLQTLSDRAFLQRYRAFHGTTPVLGYFHNRTDGGLTGFVPTTAFRPHAAATAHRTCVVLDCRHGRALLYDSGSSEFVVWDPITGRERRIPDKVPDVYYTNHAVLCAAGAGCDHSSCSGGPFLLACVGVHGGGPFFEGNAYACFYSSETGARSVQTHLRLEHDHCSGLDDRPPSFVGGALYFASYSGDLLRYDVLGGHGLSVMELPPADSTIVMTAGNGGLGLATFDHGMLALWSSEMGPNGDARWVHTKFIDLHELLPVDFRMSVAWLSGFAEDANVIFLSTDDNGIFTIELKSFLTRKVCEKGNVNHVFPYVSFYTPAGYSSSRTTTQARKNRSAGRVTMMRDQAKIAGPGSPWAMENEQWYGEGVEKADDEPPTKRQKGILPPTRRNRINQ